jgi:cytochrome c biogenesis protein CcmG, thiol:disulfide interchange protein DsbE
MANSMFRKFAVALTLLGSATVQAAVGDVAKLDGPLMNGEKFSLEAEHGKVVLVVLWATWCPVCRRELPKLQEFYEKNAAKGFEIAAVSIDDTPKEVSDFLQKNKYSFPIGWRNRFKDNLGPVRGTPTIYLIGRNGKIRARTEGALDDSQWWAIEDEIANKDQPHAAYELELLPGLRHRAL